MPGEYRAFRMDFCDHMGPDGWPAVDPFKSWLDQKNLPYFKSGGYALVKKGVYQPARYCRDVIRYLVEESPLPERIRKRNRLIEYLRAQGIPDPRQIDVKDIIEKVCRPVRKRPALQAIGDSFRDGLSTIRDMFTFRKVPWTYVRMLQEDEEHLVRESIRWMFIELGRSVAGPKMRAECAIKQGEVRIGITEAEYEESAIAWWKAEPWTVIRAWNGSRAVGMSIGLPVARATYEAVRDGQLKSYTCTAQQFRNPSPDLLVEGASMRPYEDGSSLRKQTNALVLAMTCQQAYLSTIPGLFTSIPLRLLAPAGTKQNERRARWIGYRPTGTCFHGTDISMLELTFQYSHPKWLRPIGASAAGAWQRLQFELRGAEAERYFAEQRNSVT